MESTKLSKIIDIAAIYEEDAKELKKLWDRMEEEIDIIKKRYSPAIEQLTKSAFDAKDVALKLMQDSGNLFIKPRSYTSGLVEVGFRKAGGGISVVDPEFTVSQIRINYPELYPVMVKESVSIVKSAIKSLTEAQLAQIGVEMTPAADSPYVKLSDAGLTDLLNRLNGGKR